MEGIGYFQNLRNFLEIFWIFLGIFWEFFKRIFLEEFIWRNFLGEIFWEDFFWKDFLGGFLGRIFWEELISRFLQGIDVFV